MEKIFFKLKKRKDGNKLCSGTSGMIRNIIERNYSDIKTAAALVCLKHHKSPKSYRTALRVLDGYKKLPFKEKDSVEIAYPYKRKSFSPYLLIGSAIVLSLLPKSEIKTVFHGENLPVSTTKDIFDYLDISTVSNEDSYNMLKNLNVGFFNRKLFLPQLSSINHIRIDLNINDIFCHIEKYLNPLSSDFAIGGVKNSRQLLFYKNMLEGRYKRFALVEDREGFPDITSSTSVYIFGDREEIIEVDLSVFGGKSFLYKKLDLSEHIDFIKDLLGKKLPEYEPLLHINSGLLLYLKDVVNDLKEGFELSRELFRKYDYLQVLKNIQKYSEYLNYKNIYEL